MTTNDTGKKLPAQMKIKLAGLGLLILLADQASKMWALAHFDGIVRPVTPFFNLVLVWNRGISFGLMQQGERTGSLILIAMALVIVTVLALWLVRTTRAPQRYAIAAVIAGALGNVIDRARFGAVVDFLDFHAMGYHWPAFNIADCAVVVGIAILMADSLFFEPKGQNAPGSNKTESP